MKRRIVAYKNYYKDFFESLDAGTQEKILYGEAIAAYEDGADFLFTISRLAAIGERMNVLLA